MVDKVPLAGEKDEWIERWIRSPGPAAKDTGGRLRLPDLGKPAAVRRGRQNLCAAFATSAYRRRVVVITSYYRMAGQGYGKLHAHLTYIERPGAGEEAVTPSLFDAREDDVRGHEAINRGWRDDRHHFRVLLAPNDGARLDMKAYVRDFMAEVERELGTKLEWFAGIHEKADATHQRNRHAHVVIRGIDDRGGDLVIDREFIKHELRRIAEELATRRLGQMSQRELDAYLARQAEREKAGERNYDLGRRAKGWDDRAKAKGEGHGHG